MPSFIGHTCCSIALAAAPKTDSTSILGELRAALGDDLRGRRVAMWGLAPAEDSGRLQGSAVASWMEALLGAGVALSVHDRRRLGEARALLGDRALLFDDPYLAAAEADALVLADDGDAYRHPKLGRLRDVMARPVILDRSGAWAELGLEVAGFDYRRIAGRGALTRWVRGGGTSELPGATVHA
jgi:UDPglucose 6-dehydrogenase